MTEQNKQRLLVSGLILAGLVILWLLLRNNSVPQASTPVVENNQQAGQLPQPGGNSVGPLTYNGGGIGGTNISNPGFSIPSLAGITMPAFSLPSGVNQACCSSCGCDNTSPVNQFAAGVGAALSNYASQMNALEGATQQALFGSLPNYISQYIASAAPNTPVSVIGA